MIFEAKFFDKLTTTELYEIIKSRTEVFMLEQNIICQDLDDVDYVSLHCFIREGKRVTAYLRAFADKENDDAVTVGRVLTLVHGKGAGTILMKKSMEEIKQKFKCKKINLHAQKRAMEFYEKLGFITVSDEFLEEGVVHVSMEREI